MSAVAPEGPRWSRADRWAALAVALCTALAFLPSLRNGFVVEWDDGISIVDNPHLRGFDWRWMFTDLVHNPRYMPLSWLRWTLTFHFFGLQPAAYHAGNLLFHVLNAVMVFALARLLTGRPGLSAGAALACAAGTLAWSIHPLRAEPVAWATDGSYMQALSFFLLALLLHLRWTRTRGGAAHAGAVLAFAAAVLSHPIVAGGAGVFFVLDWYRGERRLLDKLPYALLALAALGITFFSRVTPETVWARPPALERFGALERAAQAFYVWTWYLWRVFVPAGLSPIYTPLVSFHPLSWPFVLSALVVAGGSVAAFLFRRRAPWFAAAWACHLVVLVPCLGLTEHPFFPSDRYGHVAGIVWAVLLAAGLQRLDALPVRPGVRRLAQGATAAALVALGALSWIQTRAWKDTLTLYDHILETLGPDPYRIEIYKRIGDYHAHRGEWAEALRAWDALLAADPEKRVIHYPRGLALFRLGQYDRAAADFAEALRVLPDPQIARLHAMSLAHLGRYAEALAELRAVVASRPRDVPALESLALALAMSGDREGARQVLDRALAIAPGDPRLIALRERVR